MFTLQQLLAPRGPDNIKTLQALYEGSFVCAQRLISLNLKATRSIMESNVSGIKAMMAARAYRPYAQPSRRWLISSSSRRSATPSTSTK